MPDANNRTTEAELSAVALDILGESQSGEASYHDLIEEIPNRITLTPEDMEQSDTRENEAVWEQRVRNITSHQKTSGNYIAEGYFESIRGGLKITDMGRAHYEHKHG